MGRFPLRAFRGRSSSITTPTRTIPTSGEDATNVWFRIHLTATDSAQASASTYVDMLPNTSTITLDARPPGQGVKVSFNGTQVAVGGTAEDIAELMEA